MEKIPFDGLRDEGVILKTSWGMRPDRPCGAPGNGLFNMVWAMMQAGWTQDPDKRPRIQTIQTHLDSKQLSVT